MIPSPQTLSGVLYAYLAPLLALAVTLAGSLVCRAKSLRPLLPMVGALGLLAGWAALLPLAFAARAALAPRGVPEALLLPAAAALLAGLAAFWGRARLDRWAGIALAVFAGWWLASSPAGRPEFWRVWAAVGVVALLLSRSVAGQPARSLAAMLALWGGLVVAGAPPGAIGAALVAAGAAAGLLVAGPLVAGPGGVLPAALAASVVAGADLASGRLVRGGLNAIDLACLAACAAPLAAQLVTARLGKRLGRVGPLVSALAGAAAAVGCAWLAARLIRR